MSRDNKTEIFNMVLPNSGPVAIPKFLDFSTTSSIDVDFTQVVNNGWVDFISGVYLDNSDNAFSVTFVCNGTNQRLTFPAGACGYIPLLLASPPKLTIAVSASGGTITPIFYNVPMLPFLFQKDLGSGGGGGDVNLTELAGVALTDFVPIKPIGSTVVDYSKAITATGVSETLFAAGECSAFLAVDNPTGNQTMTINLAGGNAALSGIPILAGGSILLESGIANAVTIAGTIAETVNAFGGS